MLKLQKFACLASFLLLVAGSASAADSSSGCGLGWQVAPKNSLISSTTRAYVNATFSSTIGMTMGTSGCAKHSIVQNDKRAIHFAEVNQGQLMIEMAQGRGEHLRGLVATLGCDPAGFDDMARALQSDYSSIFPSLSGTSAPQMLNGVKASLSKSRLAQQCGFST
jgi:hypothetical protein